MSVDEESRVGRPRLLSADQIRELREFTLAHAAEVLEGSGHHAQPPVQGRASEGIWVAHMQMLARRITYVEPA
ncbi:MAG: hypothetical protein CVU56_28025 [Deltaproteobacteria bacterium HGW-Deltaproteobacteria-14]|nr:MAG: hypothetical protein CVU56_28025 [Deltaproteobacteria bacterium HGW-Deltaproteobacteria-14]